MGGDEQGFKFGPVHAAGGAICAALAIAIPFIQQHEGTRLSAYQDVAGVYTICSGQAYVPAGTTATAAQCEAMTQSTVGKFMSQVYAIVPHDTPAPTLAAYTSFAYNIGMIGFSHSTTLKLANSGDIRGACQAMLKWYEAGGKDCRVRSNGCFGVWQRRLDERDLCLQGVH